MYPWLLFVTLVLVFGISKVLLEIDFNVFVKDYPVSPYISPWSGGCGWDVSGRCRVLLGLTTTVSVIILFVHILDDV